MLNYAKSRSELVDKISVIKYNKLNIDLDIDEVLILKELNLCETAEEHKTILGFYLSRINHENHKIVSWVESKCKDSGYKEASFMRKCLDIINQDNPLFKDDLEVTVDSHKEFNLLGRYEKLSWLRKLYYYTDILEDILKYEDDEYVISFCVKVVLNLSDKIDMVLPFLYHYDPRVRSNSIEALFSRLSVNRNLILTETIKMIEAKNPRIRTTLLKELFKIDEYYVKPVIFKSITNAKNFEELRAYGWLLSGLEIQDEFIDLFNRKKESLKNNGEKNTGKSMILLREDRIRNKKIIKEVPKSETWLEKLGMFFIKPISYILPIKI